MDLTSTAFIVHYRTDCEDRVNNLHYCLDFLSNYITSGSITLINDDASIDPNIRRVKNKYPNIRFLFCENVGDFRKAYCLNQAAATTTEPVLCFYDVDVLISPEQLKEAQDYILEGKMDHVYPYNGIFIDVKKPFFGEFLSTYDFKKLQDEVTSTALGFYNGRVHVISDMSPGGCSLISRPAFNGIGGYDDKFIGWGFEDTDFRDRSKKVNRQTYLSGPKYLFHLNHSTHDDQVRSNHAHYMNNVNLFYKNSNE